MQTIIFFLVAVGSIINFPDFVLLYKDLFQLYVAPLKVYLFKKQFPVSVIIQSAPISFKGCRRDAGSPSCQLVIGSVNHGHIASLSRADI